MRLVEHFEVATRIVGAMDLQLKKDCPENKETKLAEIRDFIIRFSELKGQSTKKLERK